jgi:AcrR family transcriptional regulator
MEEYMNKQPEITDQTKANLLEAFWSLYAQKRIEQITVKEITAKAGYNRGTFYEYFRDVYQCLDYIEDLALPNFEELPPMPNSQSHCPDVFESFIALYQEKFEYYDVLLGERGDPSFQRKLIDSVKAAILGSGKNLRSFDPLELDFMLEYMLSGMIGVMRYFFHGRHKCSQAEVMAIIYRSMDNDFFRQIHNSMA